MAKVTVIFEDKDDKVDVKLKSVPAPPPLEEFSEKATPAQMMAMSAIAGLAQDFGVVDNNVEVNG